MTAVPITVTGATVVLGAGGAVSDEGLQGARRSIRRADQVVFRSAASHAAIKQ
jgi:hypothetical protein